MAKSGPFLTFLLFFYYWLLGIVLFFVPKSLRQLKSVKDEIVLITGSGSGLGRILAIRFAQLGAHPILWDINKSGLEETVRLVTDTNPSVKCKSYVCDITDRQAVYENADRIKRDIGSVTILVNNAGVVSGKNFIDIPDDKIIQTFNVNVISHFWTVKAFLPDMMAKNKGHLVSIASVGGMMCTCKLTDYCASKFACVGFEETLRLELMNADLTGIKSTIALPGFMNTGMFDGFHLPIFPLLQPEDVANEIMYGILTDAEYVVVPKSFYVLNTLKTFIPVKAYYRMCELLGALTSMDGFVGRQSDQLNHNLNNNIDDRKIK